MGDSSDRDQERLPGSSADTAAAEPTIVGGRPPGRGSGVRKIPRGIDVLIKKASIDPEFRAILLEKRAEAAAEIELELSPAEAATLNAVPRAQIEKIVERATVPDEQRRIFLGKAAAAMLAALCMPVSAAAWEFEMKGEFEGRLRYFRRWRETPRHVSVHNRGHRLGFQIASEGPNWLSVSVYCNCPFDLGEIEITFRDRDDSASPFVKSDPLRAPVSRGQGEVPFHAHGTRGTTEWILICLRRVGQTGETSFATPISGAPVESTSCAPFDWRLLAADHPLLPWPPAEYRPGEYIDGTRAVYRIAKFHKMWSPEG